MSDLSVTGKLTVSGLIDPTGLVLDEQAASPFNAAGKHTIWAKNTIPTTLWTTDDANNDYQIATSATQALANVLVIGAATGGTDIIVSSGDSIVGEDGVAAPGGSVPIIAGAGDGVESGGAASLTGGSGGATGAGGTALLSGGAGGATSGAGGDATCQGGSATGTNSNGGTLYCYGGLSTGTGTPGAVSIVGASALSGNAWLGVRLLVSLETGMARQLAARFRGPLAGAIPARAREPVAKRRFRAVQVGGRREPAAAAMCSAARRRPATLRAARLGVSAAPEAAVRPVARLECKRARAVQRARAERRDSRPVQVAGRRALAE